MLALGKKEYSAITLQAEQIINLLSSCLATSDSFPTLYWGHHPYTWTSLLLHSQVTLMNPLPPSPQKLHTSKAPALNTWRAGGPDSQEMQLCIFPFHALSIFFLHLFEKGGRDKWRTKKQEKATALAHTLPIT